MLSPENRKRGKTSIRILYLYMMVLGLGAAQESKIVIHNDLNNMADTFSTQT